MENKRLRGHPAIVLPTFMLSILCLIVINILTIPYSNNIIANLLVPLHP